MAQPRVFVVDDQPSFRRAARAVITAAGYDFGGEADSASTAMTALSSDPPPDLVLVDVNLGADSGIELTRTLVATNPALRIVLVSTMAAIDLPSDATAVGAVGFVEKSRLDPALLHTLLADAGRARTPMGGV